MKAVIFAGGTGKRLWPLSRKNSPKQVIPFLGNKTSLQHSLDIVKGVVSIENIYIAISKGLKDEILDIVAGMKPSQLILESSIRDTGPALGYSLLKLSMKNPDEPVLIRWQNSLVKNPAKYKEAVKHAGDLLDSQPNVKIVYVSVPSKYPNTRIGYIRRGDVVHDYGDGILQYEFKGFQEKPELSKAQELHDAGHCWNAGCYITTPARFLGLVKRYAPDLYSNLMKIRIIFENNGEEEEIYKIYDQIECVAVDYIISENLSGDSARLIIADYDWHYVSTWDNVHNALQNKSKENVFKGNIEILNTENSLIFNDDDDFLVATIGVKDLCIVKHGNVVLVCSRKDAGRVKELYKSLANREDAHKYI